MFRFLLRTYLLLTVCVAGFSSQGYAEIVVQDYLKREVSLPHAAQRIVGLAPHVVENLYAAGAGDKMVGAVAYSNYPEAATKLPLIGSFHAVNYEALLALKPDLVVIWHSGNGEKVLRQLEKLGLSVYVDEPRRLDDVAKTLRDLGKLAGTEKLSEQKAVDYMQQLQQLRKQYSDQTPVSVLYQVWHDPLQTINDKHLISDVIRLCGGRNAFADAIPLAPKLTLEAVLQRDPVAIVTSGMDEARPEWLDEWRKWPTLKAVRHGHLFFIPPDLIQRHTPRILQGAKLMCKHLQQTR